MTTTTTGTVLDHYFPSASSSEHRHQHHGTTATTTNSIIPDVIDMDHHDNDRNDRDGGRENNGELRQNATNNENHGDEQLLDDMDKFVLENFGIDLTEFDNCHPYGGGGGAPSTQKTNNEEKNEENNIEENDDGGGSSSSSSSSGSEEWNSVENVFVQSLTSAWHDLSRAISKQVCGVAMMCFI